LWPAAGVCGKRRSKGEASASDKETGSLEGRQAVECRSLLRRIEKEICRLARDQNPLDASPRSTHEDRFRLASEV